MRAERKPRGLLTLLAAAGIALQFSGDLFLSTLALLFWVLAMWAYYPCVLKRMWIPRFWTLTLLVALGSGLLIGPRDETFWGIAISTQGLSAGALMVLRGAFIFALAAWASKALANSGLDRLAARFGAGSLALSAGVAIELLPELADRIQEVRTRQSGSGRRGRWKSAYLSAVNLLADCAMMADSMAKKDVEPAVVIITGPIGSGKTKAARELAAALVEHGVTVGGVIQPRSDGGDSYFLQDVATGRRWPFASFDLNRREGKTGYIFSEEGWAIAYSQLKWASRHMEVVVLDEIGLLEAEGKGHWPAFRHGFDSGSAKLWILVVRRDRLDLLSRRLGRVAMTISIPSDNDLADIALSLKENIIEAGIRSRPMQE